MKPLITHPLHLLLVVFSTVAVGIAYFLFNWPEQTALGGAVNIPYSQTIPDIDGQCAGDEYGAANRLFYNYGAGGPQGLIRMQHDGNQLYVCVAGIAGSYDERFFRVYIDSDNGKEQYAERDDFAFQADVLTGANSSYAGTGVPDGYVPVPFVGWLADTNIVQGQQESAEFSIPVEMLTRHCGQRFGIAVYHHWLNGVGDDYGWPSNMYFDQPHTWAEAFLENPGCATPTPTRTPLPTWTPIPTNTPTPGPTPTAVPPIYAVPYLPIYTLPIVPPVVSDLSIHGIEITQGVQCFDTSKGLAGCPDNSLRVVTRKNGTARIYLKITGPLSSMNNVPVRLYIRANNVWYTANVSGKATTAVDQSKTDSANVFFIPNFSNDVVIDFYAVVDPNNTIPELNENNNRFPAVGYITRTFERGRSLDIVGQRLRYHPSGYTGTQYAGGWAVNGGAADWFEQMLPIRNNGIKYKIKSGYLNWTTTLSTGDGQHALIQHLNARWVMENAFAWLFGSGAFTGADHVYGWAPNDGYSGGHADMPVYPHAGGLGVVGIGTDRPGTSTDNPGGGALIFGHELVHDYDVKHTNVPGDCGSNDSSSVFPYANASIQEFGFNTITGKIYNPSNTHDLMSYCPAGGSREGWISPYTWNYMFGELTLLAQRKAGEIDTNVKVWRTTQSLESLVVNATVYNPASPDYNPDQPGELGELYRITGGISYLLPAGEYRIELRNAAGGPLYSQSFHIDFESEYDPHAASYHPGPQPQDGDPPFPPEPAPRADVSFVMPWVEGTTQVVLLHNNTVLDSQAVSNNAPTVTITSPAAQTTWPAGSEQTITWTFSDADGDSATFSVFYSHDGGVNWDLLATELVATSFNVLVDSLAGTSDGRFRVVATDGVNIGYDETDHAITIPNKAPLVYIMDPLPNQIFRPGALVVFQGGATDLEDGDLSEGSLEWSSDVQGELGIGTTLPITTLLPGPHVITLTARDSYGVTETATVNIFIGYGIYLPAILKP